MLQDIREDATVEALCRRHGLRGAVIFTALRADALIDQNKMEAAAVWLDIMVKIEKIQHRIWDEEFRKAMAE